jgi:manganese/iron transport system permease protein
VLGDLVEPFALPFMQRALAEVCLLSLAGGLLGSWIVLRRLAFYTHAVGTATFPGLVLAEAWAIAPPLAALGTALGMSGALEWLARRRGIAGDAATGLLLVGFLALGTVLASDVFTSGAGVDRLLFGSLLGLSDLDLALTALVAALAVGLDAALHRTWLASGFDAAGVRALGVPAAVGDRALLGLIAAAAVVTLSAVGSLLVIAVLVFPAATARLLTSDVRALRLGAAGLALVEGIAALWLADALDIGPGPALSLVGGAAFAAALLATRGREAAA